MFLQYIYKPILNAIYKTFTCRISENKRNLVVTLGFFTIFVLQFLSQYIFLYQGLNRGIRDYAICLILGIIIIFSMNKEVQIEKWNKVIYIPYILIGICLLIAAFDHEMGPSYKAFPVFILVVFMCLYFVWGNRKDWHILFDCIAQAYCMFSLIVFFLCVCCSSYYEHLMYFGYAPFDINPNGVAKIFVPGIACGLYMLLTKDRLKWLYGFITAASLAVTHLADSRSGSICALFLCILTAIFAYCSARNKAQNQYDILKWIMIACLIAILFGFSVFLIKDVSGSIYDLNHPNKNTIIVDGTTQKKESSDTNTPKSERDNIVSQKIENIEKESSNQGELYQKLNVISRGRLAIWNEYFSHMTFRGKSKLMFVDTEYAHNQYIELAYKAGILTGILYFLFTVLAGISLIKNFLKKSLADSCCIFQSLVYIPFFLLTMFDTGILPMERGFIFIYYVSLAPLFFSNQREKKQNAL